jgi:hypothetical protein
MTFFKVAPASNGKGLGWFATADIEPQVDILEEKPLFVAPKTANEAAIAQFVERLSPNQRKEWSTLATGREMLVNTFQVYSLGMRAGPMGLELGATAGVFSRICRINHSCAPNVVVAWDPDRGVMCVQTLVSIKAGAEITKMYLDSWRDFLLPSAERKALLASSVNGSSVGFACACSVCTVAEPKRGAENDTLRGKLAGLLGVLEKLPSGDARLIGLVGDVQALCEELSLCLPVLGTDVVMKLISVLMPTVKASTTATCVACGTGGALFRCSRCHTAVYCSKEHQHAHWKKHKLSCVSSD